MKTKSNNQFEKHVLMRLKKIIEDDNYASTFIGLKEYREMLVARINVLQFGLMKKNSVKKRLLKGFEESMINRARLKACKTKKKKIKIRWTCSDYCHKEHKTKFTAWLHGRLMFWRLNRNSNKDIITRCANICGRPFYQLAPSCIEIDRNSHEPLDANISQRDLFSFINELMKLREQEILQLIRGEIK